MNGRKGQRIKRSKFGTDHPNFKGNTWQFDGDTALDSAVIVRLKAELEHFGEVCPANREVYEQYKELINDEQIDK